MDMELVRQAIGMDARSKEKLTAQMRRLTALANPKGKKTLEDVPPRLRAEVEAILAGSENE